MPCLKFSGFDNKEFQQLRGMEVTRYSNQTQAQGSIVSLICKTLHQDQMASLVKSTEHLKEN